MAELPRAAAGRGPRQPRALLRRWQQKLGAGSEVRKLEMARTCILQLRLQQRVCENLSQSPVGVSGAM